MSTLFSTEYADDETKQEVNYGTVDVPVLIIGAGAAGVRTAIELTERDIECLVLGKRTHGDAHTTWAAGGINAAFGNLDPEDDWMIHAADTFDEGHFINDPTAVETLIGSVNSTSGAVSSIGPMTARLTSAISEHRSTVGPATLATTLARQFSIH